MEVILWIICGIVVLFLIASLIDNVPLEKRKSDLAHKISNIDDFSADHTLIGADGQSALGIDENARKVCLLNKQDNAQTIKVVCLDNVLSADLDEDGTTIASQSSSVPGALAGGAVAGGVGAAIGASKTGGVSTSDSVSRLELRLTVDDTTRPTHAVSFLKRAGHTPNRGSSEHRKLRESAMHYLGVMQVLMQRADHSNPGTRATQGA